MSNAGQGYETMSPLRRNILLMVLMIAASGLAFALYPTHRIADDGKQIDLESMIPKKFGDWQLDETIVPIKVSQEIEANLNRIYNQTLSRTYVNKHGDRIMLSIAYGSDQSTSLQVHRPDVCFTAQGFQISEMASDFVRTDAGQLPVMHMVAIKGQRIEPITYWITVGDRAVRGWFEQKLAKVRYGLTGTVASGILVRVSNITTDAPITYRNQEVFINDMLKAMQQGDRLLLVGKIAL
jgi:EpsI family protein